MRAASDLSAREIAQRLAARIVELSAFLLPAGHREGAEWRCGSLAGEPGNSVGVHLTGAKAGVWSDFSTTEQKGDALDLVREVLGLKIGDAIRWSLRWLGLEDGEASSPEPPASRTAEAKRGSDYWRKAFSATRSINQTIAETYLVETRKLKPPGPMIEVLRFAARHPRRNTDDALEHHPALLALLSDIRTGEPSGLINVYLRPDGTDRLRDRKGKTSWGRAAGSAVMLSPFDDMTMGLTICEGLETGLALLTHNLAPVWCCGGAGNLAAFPVLGGIEALTIAADADASGQNAAARAAQRWREAGRDVVVIAPPSGDWADCRRKQAA